MSKQVSILKADGDREVFERGKLEASLLRVGVAPVTVKEIADHIEGELVDGVTTSDIYRHAFNLIRKHQKPVAAKYSLRRALTGLGPTGFPFEKFIAEIFKQRGFETQIDQMVQGACVPHEMDVVAYNADKLIMSEVKFHNELGYKTDLKVALYVKARFDDLKKSTFEYGGKARPLDEGWLITNTKFSQTAIDYGRCAGLTMVGWNYPEKGNLEDLIEESGLHPITCLSGLSESHLAELFKRGVVLCKTLKADPSLLPAIGLTGAKITEVNEEIASLC